MPKLKDVLRARQKPEDTRMDVYTGATAPVPSGSVTLAEWIDRIRSGEFESKVTKVRQLLSAGVLR